MTDEEKSQYFQVALCSSLVLFGFDGEELKILVYKKLNDPFKGGLILPGKYIAPTVSNDQAIHELLTERIAYDEHQTYIEQLKAFTKVFRNPLGRVVNVAYYALVKLTPDLEEKVKVHGGEWFPYDRVPDLAFDHNEIIKYAKERVKRRVKRRPVGFNLLGEEFTIAQLQSLYEKALNRELDKRNFRKKIFNSNLIIETGNTTDPKLHRKVSKLYRFDEEKYEKLSLKGYDFLF
ncbi:NrtR DNA-binding winged helix domain-containing protein [Chishuiella sp.]|uniref:NUDIX hydrolase n=1 Tax=Chishuiella sp. TaxID=1969467 RepID=UPI0028A5A8A3|nr:NUDIX hydrolase [Chishuiella sp.]